MCVCMCVHVELLCKLDLGFAVWLYLIFPVWINWRTNPENSMMRQSSDLEILSVFQSRWWVCVWHGTNYPLFFTRFRILCILRKGGSGELSGAEDAFLELSPQRHTVSIIQEECERNVRGIQKTAQQQLWHMVLLHWWVSVAPPFRHRLTPISFIPVVFHLLFPWWKQTPLLLSMFGFWQLRSFHFCLCAPLFQTLSNSVNTATPLRET